MHTSADKTPENQKTSLNDAVARKKDDLRQGCTLEDNRPQTLQLRNLKQLADNREKSTLYSSLDGIVDNRPQTNEIKQLRGVGGKFTVQRGQPVLK